jgi:hypothetical protein
VHGTLDGGRFGLHPRCARTLDSGGDLHAVKHRVKPVTGHAAILARRVGSYGGPSALDVLARAFHSERVAYYVKRLPGKKDAQETERQDRDAVAWIYAKERKRRGKGKWRAAAVSAMEQGKDLFGVKVFQTPGAVRTRLSRLQAKKKGHDKP